MREYHVPFCENFGLKYPDLLVEQLLDLSIPENKMMLAFYLAASEVENDRRAVNVFLV